MKKIIVTVLALLICTVVWADGQQEEDAKAEIEENLQIYAQSFSAGQAETWLDLHEAMAYKMPQNSPMFTIKSVMGTQQEMLDSMQAAYEVDMEIDPMEIEVSGDIAYAMGTYKIDMVPRGDAPPNFMDGKFLTVFRRQSDGSWKIWRDSYSSNIPPK